MAIPRPTTSKSTCGRRPNGSSLGRCLLWGILFLSNCVWTSTATQAGCSGLGDSTNRWVETKPPVAGQMVLSLYVRYERGSLSFTLEPPTRPCEGPGCRTKSAVEPTLLPIFGQRLVVSNAGISSARCAAGERRGHHSYARPTSQFASSGELEVPEPPPKEAC